MKCFIYAASAALLVCSAIACQKNADISPQLIGDTVLTKCSMFFHVTATNEQYPVRVNYWMTGKEISKISIEPGDTLYDFVRNDKGNLIHFRDQTATVKGETTSASTYELSYTQDKITMIENWQSFENGYSGVTTRFLTLKDSLITTIEEWDGQQLNEKTDYVYDASGNVIKEMRSVAKETITYTYFKEYRNPLLINGECRLINFLFGAGSYMSPNYTATETNKPDGNNAPNYTVIAKYVVNDHWGSFPTKVHASSDVETIDFSYDYSVR
ncbi:hypothetical protein [Pinibacter soli]|uniref:DUF4595 domain-containing protein n=1 Tax=Pinibacter soli TaxID=3044211 RepID=A0ABT6RA22_9BACT|nr:hypothetical protein [Pinibacter soli]MDI3319422.1 hypothetical protein [Pinibacter soli]